MSRPSVVCRLSSVTFVRPAQMVEPPNKPGTWKFVLKFWAKIRSSSRGPRKLSTKGIKWAFFD